MGVSSAKAFSMESEAEQGPDHEVERPVGPAMRVKSQRWLGTQCEGDEGQGTERTMSRARQQELGSIAG